MFVERSDGELVEMTQQGFESEDLFQELLGKHPALILDDQIGTQSPRRWLLTEPFPAAPRRLTGRPSS